MISPTDIIGFTAAVVGTPLMLPQVIKTYRAKKVEDLSVFMVLLYIFNCALWLTYGIMIRAFPVSLANTAGLIISLVLLFLWFKYRAAPTSR